MESKTSLESLTELPIPDRIELFEDHLIADLRMHKRRLVKPAMFYNFTALDPTDSNGILCFARSWGTMGICQEHCLPVSHALIPGRVARCFPRRSSQDDMSFLEPLGFWRRAIAKAAALGRIAADIRNLDRGRREDWLIIRGGLIHEGGEPWKKLSLARSLLAHEVQTWLDIGAVRPSFSWDSVQRRWAVRHAIPREVVWPLFGWLGLRLMIEISGGRVVVCPYCQTEYFPQRLPGAHQDHCCGNPKCKRAYWANYKRKQKERIS
jgi:hypothetical protein